MITSFLAAFAACSPTPAELPADLDVSELGASVRPLVDLAADGSVWAAGSDWKLHASTGGVRFFPRVGPNAPTSIPLWLRVEGAAAGDRVLRVADRPTISVTADRRRIDIDHGAFVESWHLRRDEVEQTFRFDRLERRGELRIDIEVLRDGMTPPLVPNGKGLRFEAGASVVLYGEATSYDAAGRRANVDLDLDHGGLSLVLPSEEVEAARLPLVIDPVVSTGGIGTPASLDLSRVDVTYDPEFDVWFVVAEHAFSASDRDVYAYVVAGDGAVTVLSDHIVDVTTASWHSPSCVRHGRTARIGIVAVFGDGNDRGIGFRRFSLSSGLMGAQQRPYTVPAFYFLGATDLGADPEASIFGEDDNYLAVFEEYDASSDQRRIRGLELDETGAARGAPTVIDFIGNPGFVGQPSISPRSAQVTGGNALEFVVAWERREPGTDSNVRYAWIRSDGAFPTPGTAPVDVAQSRFRGRPSVGSIGFVSGRWRCSVGHVIDVPNVGPDVEVATVEWGGPTKLSNVSIMEGVSRDDDQLAPALSSLGGRTSIAYLERPPGGSALSTRVRFCSGDLAGRGRMGLAERKVAADGTIVAPEEPALALRAATGGQPGLDGLLVWPARGRLYASRVTSMDVDLAGFQYCLVPNNSTGEPGWMRVVGQPGPGVQALRLEAYDLPQGVFGYFLCALGSGNVPNVGGSVGTLCLSGNRFGRFAQQVQSSGPFGRIVTIADSGALPQATGTTAAMAGETWCFQCWHRDSQLGVPVSNLSNAVAVEFQ
ncbi:MAG: hypothetical protein AAGA20_03550 [Planctomycetota bacterium]